MLPLFLLLQAAAAPAPATAPAPWTLQTRTDPASGATATFAAARSRDGKARLVVRCDRVGEPAVSVQFQTREPALGAADDHLVSLAADGAAPIDAVWRFPGNAALIAEPEAVTRLAVAIAAAREVSVTTTDGASPLLAIFDGPAGTSAVGQVLAACGYTLGVVPPPIKPDKQRK